MKHVVIESSTDPVAGIVYHITPNGPRFHTLYDLIEQARKEPVIQNHSFEIILGKSPHKVGLITLCTSLSLWGRVSSDIMEHAPTIPKFQSRCSSIYLLANWYPWSVHFLLVCNSIYTDGTPFYVMTSWMIGIHVFFLSPLQPDMRWFHKGVKSLSQAEQLLKRDHRDGAFFVYRTKSEHSPYIVAFRLVSATCLHIVHRLPLVMSTCTPFVWVM